MSNRCAFALRRRLLLAAGTSALVSVACGGGDDDKDADPPALQPIDSNRLRATVADTARDQLVPGVVVLLRTPQGDFTSLYGVNRYRGSTPTSADQHFRVGSVTKTWTSTVILQQVQEGLLQLSDPIGKYIAGVPKGEQITIEQLLLMRSGLFNYSTTVAFNQALDDAPARVWQPEEMLALAFAHEQSFDPGTSYEYSNTNTILLGLVAQQVEHGKPLADIMRDRLFRPLGLRHTRLPTIEDASLPTPFTYGYQYGSNVQTLHPLPADLQAAARAGTLAPIDHTNSNISWGWSAGSGISTANDLLIFVRALVGGGLLNPQMQAARLASVRDIVPPNPELGYGWNLARFGALYGHTGEIPGYGTFMGHDPANKVTLIVWANLETNLEAGSAASAIARKLIAQIYPPAP